MAPPFRARNPYYLRISDRNVLPLYVYLDAQHLDWMSDLVLQRVLADLQPMILPKLKAETDASGNSKKPTVDVHRGDSYQFCYFIRKTEPHSVLIKARHFSAAPPVQKRADVTSPPPPPPPTKAGSKRKGAGNASASKRRKTKGKGKAREGDESEEEAVSSEEDEGASRRSRQAKKGAPLDDDDYDVEMEDSEQVKEEPSDPRLSLPPGAGNAATAPIDLDLDEEEKPKPVLQLKYQDFSIYGHCLCIVVEPYPPLRLASRGPSASRAQSAAPFALRELSVAPVSANTAARARAQTPLFLPDDDDERERSVTPFPRRDTLPPVPLFHEVQDDDGREDTDNGGMMAFSQAMSAFTHLPAGAVEDDDDMDGAVFFGDADEVREL